MGNDWCVKGWKKVKKKSELEFKYCSMDHGILIQYTAIGAMKDQDLIHQLLSDL